MNMENNEKRRFMYGIFALVLAISVGYFGISSMGSSYALTQYSCTIDYMSNSGDSSSVPTSTEISGTGKLSSQIPTRSGYTFIGWKIGENTYASGSDYTCPSNGIKTAFAQWKEAEKCYLCSANGNLKWSASTPSDACSSGWSVVSSITTSDMCQAVPEIKCTYNTYESCKAENPNFECSLDGTISDKGVECYAPGNKITYTITYDANGGKNAPGSQTKNKGEDLTLSSTEPTRDGYTFLGWSTDKNATSAAYGKGSSYKTDSDVTLYAVWKLNSAATYIVTYDANGGKNAPSSQTKNKGEDLTLSSDKPTRDGYTFLGWSTDKNATSPTYGSNGIYDIDSDITLYAVWKINTTGDYVVTFDTGYGIITINADKDATIEAIETPVREGYTFAGWYADKEYKNKYDFNTKITSDLTLYAKWEKKEKTDDELDKNIKTGDVMMFIAWTIGIGALAYGVYYYKTRIED